MFNKIWNFWNDMKVPLSITAGFTVIHEGAVKHYGGFYRNFNVLRLVVAACGFSCDGWFILVQPPQLL